MAGMLYLVPTPIGNLGDISIRARETLEKADFIAAEDTRVTLRLLNHLGIKKSLVSYYEHNKTFKGERIVDRILAGETCALVSDAGSPAISDPGEDLVKQCAQAGIVVCANVRSLPIIAPRKLSLLITCWSSSSVYTVQWLAGMESSATGRRGVDSRSRRKVLK